MILNIKVVIEREYLIWATYMLYINGKSRVNKKNVLNYLRQQICLFGTNETRLFGETYLYDRDYNILEKNEFFKSAIAFVDLKFGDK